MEMIAEQVLGLDRAKRRLKPAVVPNRLIEDRQVKPALQMNVAQHCRHRIHHPHRRRRQQHTGMATHRPEPQDGPPTSKEDVHAAPKRPQA